MNFWIINSDILFANSLKKLLQQNMVVDSIQIARDFKSLLQNDITSANIILFEATLENINDLERFQNINKTKQTKFVALTDKIENEHLLKAIKIGVSSIISKTERIEFIVEELQLVLRGKGSFPVNVINSMKEILVIEERKGSFRLINIFSKYISNKKEKIFK